MSRTEAMPREEVLSLLAAAPARIAEATDGFIEAQLHAEPQPGEWSVNEVLAHLRACADMWGDAARAIADGTPKLRAVNPRHWIKKTDYPTQGFADSLAAYTAQREQLVSFLESLPASVWSRTGVITGAGAPLQRSVHHYAQWLARHERSHLKQIATTAEAVAARDRTCPGGDAQPE